MTPFTKQDVAILKAEIEFSIGRRILTTKDCSDLSEAIFKKTECRISTSTLKRVFGLVKSQYEPSITTLDMLAAYCGAQCFDALVAYKRRTQELPANDMLMLLKYLTAIYQQVHIPHVNDGTFINLTRKTIEFLNNHTSLALLFQKAVANTVNGKRFYFEFFVNVDKLNLFYGQGLLHYLEENKMKDAQIFGHALLCFKHWLMMEPEKLASHHKKLVEYTTLANIPVATCAHYFAGRLFYAADYGLGASVILMEANDYYKSIKNTTEPVAALHYFEFVFAQALMLTGNYYEAQIYITAGLQRGAGHHQPDAHNNLFKALTLYHAIVALNTGDSKKAAEVFDRVNPAEFYFIYKQFHTILYLQTGIKLGRLRANNQQLDFLAGTTGFKKMLRMPCT